MAKLNVDSYRNIQDTTKPLIKSECLYERGISVLAAPSKDCSNEPKIQKMIEKSSMQSGKLFVQNCKDLNSGAKRVLNVIEQTNSSLNIKEESTTNNTAYQLDTANVVRTEISGRMVKEESNLNNIAYGLDIANVVTFDGMIKSLSWMYDETYVTDDKLEFNKLILSLQWLRVSNDNEDNHREKTSDNISDESDTRPIICMGKPENSKDIGSYNESIFNIASQNSRLCKREHEVAVTEKTKQCDSEHSFIKQANVKRSDDNIILNSFDQDLSKANKENKFSKMSQQENTYIKVKQKGSGNVLVISNSFEKSFHTTVTKKADQHISLDNEFIEKPDTEERDKTDSDSEQEVHVNELGNGFTNSDSGVESFNIPNDTGQNMNIETELKEIKTQEEETEINSKQDTTEIEHIELNTQNDSIENKEANKTQEGEKDNDSYDIYKCEESQQLSESMNTISDDFGLNLTQQDKSTEFKSNETEKANIKFGEKLDSVSKRAVCTYAERTVSVISRIQNVTKLKHGTKSINNITINKSPKDESIESVSPEKEEHSEEGTYKCEVCNERFKRLWYLTKHSIIHGEKNHESNICKETFSESQYLHTNENVSKGQICEKTFTQFDTLKTHTQSHSSTPCKRQICKKIFKSANELNCLKETHLNGKEIEEVDEYGENQNGKSKNCDQKVPQVFASGQKDKTDTSISEVNQNSPAKVTEAETLTCKTCGKTFHSKFILELHEAAHSVKRSYKREICNKKFTQDANYQKHMLLHTKTIKCPCPTCGIIYSSYDALQAHMKHHKKEEPIPLKRQVQETVIILD